MNDGAGNYEPQAHLKSEPFKTTNTQLPLSDCLRKLHDKLQAKKRNFAEQKKSFLSVRSGAALFHTLTHELTIVDKSKAAIKVIHKYIYRWQLHHKHYSVKDSQCPIEVEIDRSGDFRTCRKRRLQQATVSSFLFSLYLRPSLNCTFCSSNFILAVMSETYSFRNKNIPVIHIITHNRKLTKTTSIM